MSPSKKLKNSNSFLILPFPTEISYKWRWGERRRALRMWFLSFRVLTHTQCSLLSAPPRPDARTRHHHHFKNDKLLFHLLFACWQEKWEWHCCLRPWPAPVTHDLLKLGEKNRKGRLRPSQCVFPLWKKPGSGVTNTLSGCPLVQNSVPTARKAQSCQAQERTPFTHVTQHLPQARVPTPRSHLLKKWLFLGFAFGSIKGL